MKKIDWNIDYDVFVFSKNNIFIFDKSKNIVKTSFLVNIKEKYNLQVELVNVENYNTLNKIELKVLNWDEWKPDLLIWNKNIAKNSLNIYRSFQEIDQIIKINKPFLYESSLFKKNKEEILSYDVNNDIVNEILAWHSIILKTITSFLGSNIEDYYTNYLKSHNLEKMTDYVFNKLSDILSQLNTENKENYIPQHILNRYKNKLIDIITTEEKEGKSPSLIIEKEKNEYLLKLPWKKVTNDRLKSISIPENFKNSPFEKIVSAYEKFILSSNNVTRDLSKNFIFENNGKIVVEKNMFNEKEEENKRLEVTIFALDGPPGIGKTYFCEQIAKVINRKFAKISLGNVSNYNYFDSSANSNSPGIILKTLIDLGVSNPLILLDEIDKLHTKGQNELLDILDQKQNDRFLDKYLDVEYDLSKIIFITSSNDINNVPDYIRSRLNVIYLGPLTLDQKISASKQIIKEFNDIYANNTDQRLVFEDNAIKTLIEKISFFEDGVRSLKENIRIVFQDLFTDNKNKLVTEEIIKKIFANEIGKYEQYKEMTNEKYKTWSVGNVNGLAVSNSINSGVQRIYSVKQYFNIPPTQHIHFLSNVTDTVKFSSNQAYHFIRSKVKEYDLEDANIDNLQFVFSFSHVYIPSDGDSAGLAFITSLLSTIKNKPISNQWAITGSIDLNGNSQAVGGIKEKIEGAYKNQGIKKFIIPISNKKDIETIDSKIVEDIEIVLVSHYDEVYKILF
ncbi:S16 family serine protease [Mycoplasma zalophi]|uniref:S16 family serine protease n=1 Tax=Mycoplasma zalophi TaxID=191287 RepID=UPI001C108F4E|nr:S16 family serine protease [Mycoplasma zalophi]MBU4690922.1 AAA family ATPase [Mycoplasma zalophi]